MCQLEISMTIWNTHLSVITSILLAGATLTTPTTAHAQSPAVPSPSPPALSLTRLQVDAFAELLGEPKEVVWRRLLADPGLVPFAAAAAATRMERKSSGKTMTIVGFTILGVGLTAGYLIILSGISDSVNCSFDSACSQSNDGRITTGFVVGLVSTGVGLAIGIPGIVRMAKQTEVETEAVDRYQYAGVGRQPVFPPGYSSALPGGARAKALNLSLLSFKF
jgi:hypothetical protein